MRFLIAVGALAFLMFVGSRGFGVILFAPVAAMGAVLLTDPAAVPPVFTGVFMDKMVGFGKASFPGLLPGPGVGDGGRAAPRPRGGAAGLHRRVHGQDGRLREALLPRVPARRRVREGHRAVGLPEVDR